MAIPAANSNLQYSTMLLLMKSVYGDVLNKTTPDQCPFLDRIQSKVKKIEGGGREWVEGIAGPLGGGTRAHADDGAMAASRWDPTYQGKIEPKMFSTTFTSTLHAMERAKASKEAFKDATRTMLENTQLKHKRIWWKMLWNGPFPGLVGRRDTIVTVTNTLDVAAVAGGFYPRSGMWIDEGDCLDSYNAITPGGADTWRADRSVRVLRKSTVVDPQDTFVVETDPTATWGATDYVFRENSRNGTTFYEPGGIPGFVQASGEHLGLDPAVSPYPTWWVSKVLANPAGAGVDRPISRALIHQLVNTIKYGDSKESPDMLVCNLAHQDAISELIWGLYQEPRGQKVVGGYGDIAWRWPGSSPVDIFFDDMCIPGNLWALNSKYLRMQMLYKTKFVDDEAGLPMIRIHGYQIFEGQITTSYNLFTVKRAAHGVLKDLEFTELSV